MMDTEVSETCFPNLDIVSCFWNVNYLFICITFFIIFTLLVTRKTRKPNIWLTNRNTFAPFYNGVIVFCFHYDESKWFSQRNAKIFNKSLQTGYVPKVWKIKRVSPLHKGESKTDCNNFRPISILPIPMKIFEKIVHDQVFCFIKESKILSDRQSGFRKLFSTSTAVLDVSDFILEQLDNKKFVGAVLIDLKKAFDTVDHKMLLKKLMVLWSSRPIIFVVLWF